jgi:hypothetical protein
MKYVVYGIPLLLLVIGLILIPIDIEETYVMLCDAVLIGLIFYFVMVRRYQIFGDRIKIVLGGPFRVNVPFSNIKELQPAGGYKSMAYSGLRLATTSRNIVEIRRKKGPGIVISPANRDMFIEQYRLAKKAYDQMYPETNNGKMRD